MIQDLNVTIIQTTLFWEDRERNLDHVDRLIGTIHGKTDLILLPEMFNTGFSLKPERCAEPMHGKSMEFLREKARETTAAIAATVMIREGETCVNRLVFYFPDGACMTYDKRHLFRLSEESDVLQAGTERVVIPLKGWKLMPMICYDLRFPVWSMNTLKNGNYEYDLLFYLANWPVPRSPAWKLLLPARAIENIAYVAAVNRIGKDGNGMDHTGDSMVVDPEGNILFQAPEHTEVVHTLTLSYGAMKRFRETFGFGLDWDPFTLH